MKISKRDVAAATIPAVIMAVLVFATTLVAERVSIQATLPPLTGGSAPFPTPNYDSLATVGWVPLAQNTSRTIFLTHNGRSPTDPISPGNPILSGNPGRYMVDIIARGTDAALPGAVWGVNIRTIGSSNSQNTRGGFYWRNLQSDRVTIVRGVGENEPTAAGEYRLRVWDFGP